MSDYTEGYKAGLQAAADLCSGMAYARDFGGNEYLRHPDRIHVATAISGLPVPADKQHQPLTEKQIAKQTRRYGPTGQSVPPKDTFIHGVRWAEQQHGIGVAGEGE